MDNIKKLIMAIIIAILVLLIVTIYLIQNNLNEVDSVSGNEVNYEDYGGAYIPNNEIKRVTVKKKYFAVKQIIDDYVQYISNSETGVDALEQMLSKDYKDVFGINRENLISKLSKYANTKIYIENMYEIEKSEYITLVIIEGITQVNNEKFNIVVKLDSENDSFEIYPEEYLNKYDYTNISLESIERKEYNKYEYKNITNLEMCNYYLQDYIYNVTTNVENAYNLLDTEYRNKRFGSLEAYKTYVNTNLDKIQNIELKEYTTVQYDNYKQYVCIDTEGNYYLFRETAIMEYTVLLDTYTLELPEFLKKYNSSSTQKKVALNINNFIQAINDKNYNYAYEVLNITFKNNNFTTQADFEAYVKQNLFEKNSVEFEEYLIQNNTNIYKISLKNSNSENSDKIEMTIIMELGTGTNFTMSFSLN